MSLQLNFALSRSLSTPHQVTLRNEREGHDGREGDGAEANHDA